MNVVASRKHLYVVHVGAAPKRVGHSVAAALMERTVLSDLVAHPEKDALSKIIVPAFLGRSILSAGVAASGLAAIGRAAINGSAACRRADSLRKTSGLIDGSSCAATHWQSFLQEHHG